MGTLHHPCPLWRFDGNSQQVSTVQFMNKKANAALKLFLVMILCHDGKKSCIAIPGYNEVEHRFIV